MASGQPDGPPRTRPVVAVVAPSCPVGRDLAGRGAALCPELELRWVDQCFQVDEGHYAGTDEARADALVAAWNDGQVDAIWCARGGAGAARIAVEAVERFDRAHSKPLLGYSDAGFLHAAMLRAGLRGAVWGPMPADLLREGGEAAVLRAARLLTGTDRPDDHAATDAVAFNLTVLCATLGTPLEPPLAGRVLLLEEVGEPLYRVDRLFWQLTSQPWFGEVAGVRLGRFAGTENDRPFGASVEEVARHWFDRAGVPLLGTADIGHNGGNKVVRMQTESSFPVGGGGGGAAKP